LSVAGARIVVADDGPGVDPQDQQRIFERFSQAASETYVGGFGLGLWVVNQVVGAHRGQVALQSAPGQGATFTLSLPRA
jgi:signal transduction histidine kinase